MCGIAGIIANEGAESLRRVLQPMTDAITHRGPDAEGLYVEAGVGLGHRRLSVIDLSEAGNQPIYDVSGRYVMIYNGEGYNFEEIRAEIPEYPWKTRTDTEVVLAAYLKWGPESLHRLNGMFAFAIWDTVEKQLFLARDRMGIKPLYIHREGAQLIFGSEVRSLLASNRIERKLNPAALVDYLTYNTVHAPNTLVAGIHQLLPGQWATFKQGQWKQETYWQLEGQSANGLSSDREVVKGEIRELLGNAVARRMVSDVPLGAFLSGGIDSSAIVALMAQASEQPVNTFSVIFQEKAFDESTWSEMIAKRYRTKHTPILLNPADFLKELPAALGAMDAPSGDGVNSYVVSKVTREAGITVALSGLGGDELFAGYPVFQQWMSLQQKSWLWKTPRPLRKWAGVAAQRLTNNHKGERLRELLSVPDMQIEHGYPIFRKLISQQEINGMSEGLPTDFNAVANRLGAHTRALHRYPQLSQVSIGEISSYTQNVLLRDTDQMSMAHALEVRVPFFDHTLVEYLLRVPDALKYPHSPKELLVDSLGELIPSEIVNRPKMGFVFPWEQWMRKDLKSFCDDRIDSLSQRGLFHPRFVKEKWQRFLAKDKKVLWLHLWLLVVLEDWLQRNGF